MWQWLSRRDFVLRCMSSKEIDGTKGKKSKKKISSR
jgi:hypothetical protein